MLMTELWRSDECAAQSLQTTWGDRGLGLVVVVYYHTTYLFIYICSYVVIMSVHDSALIKKNFMVSMRG